MKKLAPAIAVLSALALGGCVSLFPKAEPAQLYRFGATPPASAGAPGSVPLSLSRVDFTRAAAGDRIMAVTGSEVAYIAAARWVSPAEVQFREALGLAFERSARVVNVATRREGRPTTLLLDVDVNAFEVRYENGRDGAPVAVMSADARLIRFPDRAVVAQQEFESRQPASANRVGAIVTALDAANSDVLGQLVQWTDQHAR